MLILKRRRGETIRIGDDITITILEIQGNRVCVGVNAPKSVAVHREEIYRKIKLEQSLAGGRHAFVTVDTLSANSGAFIDV